ncbi:hypothetical protein SAMN05421740_104230 [Parapedobacter koreensis]|uniref:Uncharacterized protein n=2 Tax=Parapedobacter koreensis TaxID=332977 RepID=A0A1H7P6H1_9SPHI|nr:hypothetical protein SAMN05421740_104230 [Parapedobacter koreensis]
MNSFKSAILLVSAFLATNCFAQGDSRQSKTVPLEKFAGYYQFPSKAGFIQFEPKDNALLAKQLWDNKEYQLIQINETNFESKEEGHKIEFLKDNSGQFTHAKLLGRIMTTKVAFNPKVTKQLSAAQLKKLEGTYSLTDDNSLQIDIRSSANGLTLKQLWDNKEIAFTPRSETFFLNDDGTFPLTFLLSEGEAVQVTCFEDDVWHKAN